MSSIPGCMMRSQVIDLGGADRLAERRYLPEVGDVDRLARAAFRIHQLAAADSDPRTPLR